MHSTFCIFFNSNHYVKLVPHFPPLHFWSCIFQSRIFLPWKFGPHFPVVWVGLWSIWSLIGPSFSGPAFSVKPKKFCSHPGVHVNPVHPPPLAYAFFLIQTPPRVQEGIYGALQQIHAGPLNVLQWISKLIFSCVWWWLFEEFQVNTWKFATS